MRRILTFLLWAVSFSAMARQYSDSLLVNYGNEYFYKLSDKPNRKLMIFLHGGVSNPYFRQDKAQISLDYIMENNTDFIRQASGNNFDLMIPISSDSMNWLTKPAKAFAMIRAFIDSQAKKYGEIYIAGFSDGGTGAYKMFYTEPAYFSGLVIFNGYPQHSNFYKTVDYSKVTDKKVVFFSTLNDKTIPYEFLLTEYCRQKVINPDTYFYLADGGHDFASFREKELNELFAILSGQVKNTKTEPIQGYVRNDVLVTSYPFRKSIVRKYNFGKETYEANRRQLQAE